MLTTTMPGAYAAPYPMAASGTQNNSSGAMLAGVCMALFTAVSYVMAKQGFYTSVVTTTGALLFVSSLRAPLRQDMALRAVLITFFMPMAAWMLTNITLLFVVMLVWVPMFAGRLERVAGIYLYSLLLLPALEVPVLIGGTKLCEFDVHDALALGAVFTVMRSPDRVRIARGDDWRMALLLLVMLFGFSRGTSVTHGVRMVINLTLDLWLPYYILSRSLKNAEAMHGVLRWLACGAVTLAVMLAFEVWRLWPVYNELFGHYGVVNNLMIKTRGALMRAAGPFNEPTSMAMGMALCFTALWMVRDDMRSRMRHTALSIVAFFGVSAPQSRNAWMALAIAVLLADVFRGRWNAMIGKIIPAFVAVVLVVALASDWPNFSESLGMSGDASDTAEYRRDLLSRGIEEFWSSPIIGYSAAELQVRLNDMRQGEGIIDFVNSYLYFAMIAGGIGLFTFVWNLFAPMMRLWRLRSRLVAFGLDGPAAYIFGSLATLAVTLLFTSFSHRLAYMTVGFFGFVAAVRAMTRAAASAAPAYPPPTWQAAPPLTA